jgi:hypothetical protein
MELRDLKLRTLGIVGNGAIRPLQTHYAGSNQIKHVITTAASFEHNDELRT